MPSLRIPITVALLATFLPISRAADPAPLPFVSPIFGDSMVLQRGKPNTLWGWSTPGDTVKVVVGDNAATGVAGADGKWMVQVDPPPAGGPYTVKISGKQTVELHDVLVGDVWLCSGQSNMGFGLGQARNGAEEVKNANYPEIRFFNVAPKVSYTRADVPRGTWKVLSPATAGGWGGVSAAAYFFARRLRESVNVPIGLVHASYGGVPAETFASGESLRPLKDFDAGIDEVDRRAKTGGPEYGNYIMHWYDEYDLGSRNGSWADSALDDSSWKPVQIPGKFEELGINGVPGLCWLRKEITLPDKLPSGQARLYLGSVEKMDTTFVNGKQVGASSWVENPRVYFAGGALKPGKNIVAIRLFKLKPDGGFLNPAADLRLVLGDGTTIPLAGEWKGKLVLDGRPPQPLPIGFENLPIMPGVLYRGMLQPIAPLALTGAIWYQGESNTERAWQYRKLLPAMVAGWRKLFDQGEFPFYIVSLPAYQHRRDKPGDDSWAEMRDAQAFAAKTISHSCLAVTVDTGDPDNIHPVDKKQVGDRLALCALAEHYGQKVVSSGPTLASVERLPGALKLNFDHTDGGLIVKGDKPGEFAIAGDDRQWQWADARVQGDAVILSTAAVSDPKFVRYAWQSNPVATLFNGAGLPAVPFRTDDWPAMTDRSQSTDDSKPASTNIQGSQYPRVHPDGSVRFRIQAPEARKVQVRLGGTFDMTRSAEGAWTVRIPPQAPGFHYYSLVVDGVAVNDPGSETFYGASRQSSAVEVPESGVDYYSIQDVPHGDVRQFRYFSKVTGAWRRAFVYTPPGYGSSSARYPVLYLQHGGGEDERGWVEQGRADIILDNLIAAKKAVPMIIVMDKGYATEVGEKPYVRAAGQPFDMRRMSSLPAFEHVVIRDLIPAIDGRYRTLTDREHRAMAGLSMGGGQAYEIVLNNVDKFAYVGGFSGVPGGNGGPVIQPKTDYGGVMADAEAFNKRMKLVWFGIGTTEPESMAKGMRGFRQAIEGAGIRHVYQESPGTSHEWLTWRRFLNDFAPRLFRDSK